MVISHWKCIILMLFYMSRVQLNFFKTSIYQHKIYFIRYPFVFNIKLPKGLSFIAFHSLICIRNGVDTVEMVFLKTISLKLPFWWVLFYILLYITIFPFKFNWNRTLWSKSEQSEFLHSLDITWIGNIKNKKVIILATNISLVIWAVFLTST